MPLSASEEMELIRLLEEENRYQATQNIIGFTEYTKEDYKANWHHISYGKKLDAFINGDIKNLMVFMPPQHGKSELSTRRTPAKMLGDNPDLKIGVVAYNHTIAAKFNRDVQRILNDEVYRSLYPDTALNNKNTGASDNYLKNADEFEIVGRNGSLVSVGVGGGLTSRKLDILIMDDLYKDAADAWSPVKRESVQDWYETVARTRLHNNSQQLLVFTRWHEDDLAGYLLKTEPENWHVVMYEAIKERVKDDPREYGEPLWEEQHSLESLEKIRRNNSIVFDSLYQQNPTPKEGLLFPETEMKRFRLSDIADSEPDGVVSVCDTADEGEDSLCHIVGYLYGNDVYIVDVIFSKEPVEVTQPLVARMLDEYNVDRSRFESNNGGKGYAQRVNELKQGRTHIKWEQTTQNKHTKIVMKSGDIKGNFYFRSDISGQSEYERYFRELTRYPKNGKVKHDDAADATTMMAIELQSQKRVKTLNRQALGI